MGTSAEDEGMFDDDEDDDRDEPELEDLKRRLMLALRNIALRLIKRRVVH